MGFRNNSDNEVLHFFFHCISISPEENLIEDDDSQIHAMNSDLVQSQNIMLTT